jgi:hypothetical protein
MTKYSFQGKIGNMKKKVLIFFLNSNVRRDYLDLFPFKELSSHEFIEIGLYHDGSFDEQINFQVSSFTRRIHAYLHKCQMLGRRYSSVMYFARVRGYFPNRLDTRHINVGKFIKASFLEHLLVASLSSVIGIKLLEKIVTLCFIFEKFKSRHLPKNISVVILPYTGGISSEWDLLVWYYNSLNIKTLAIQENWDNLSSKQFLFQHPSNFATWARQSSSHLRSIQNFKGTINEIGCIRVQGFYENRHQLDKKPLATEKYSKHDFLSILVIGIGDPLSDLKLLTSLSGYYEEKSDELTMQIRINYRVHPFHHISEETLHLIAELPNVETYYKSSSDTNSMRIQQVMDSDVVISLFSTVILESSILNKFCIIPTYVLQEIGYDSTKLVDDYNHFAGMSLLNGLCVANSLDELVTLLNGHYAKKTIIENDQSLLGWFCEDKDSIAEIISLVQ